MDATKRLSALVTGLSRRLFHDDDSITDDLLKVRLRPPMAPLPARPTTRKVGAKRRWCILRTD